MTTVNTIGHSTRPIEEFISLLNQHGITRLVDIRTVPGSRHNPQYGQQALEDYLGKNDIEYVYQKDLGGLRPKVQHSINMGWHNQSFRNYADYMQTDEFKKGIEELIAQSREHTIAIMCAEAVPWRCHRSLVGDALLVRDIKVVDIISETSSKEHTLTSFANVRGTDITYPSDTPT
jgi:uncharacterized protein (DUF488 family)